MRRLVLLLLPGVALADTRIDMAPLPDLSLIETAYHLDRGTDWEARTKSGVIANVGAGYDAANVTRIGEATIAAGKRTQRYFVAASSELDAGDEAFVRGRHQAYLRMRSDGHDEGLGGLATFGATLEHGEARAMAPVTLGPGRHDQATAFAEELVAVEQNPHDAIWGVLARFEGGATKWLDAPLLDHAYHGAFAMGIAATPDDEEFAGGRIEFIGARVEQGRIMRKLAAAGAPSIGEVKTRALDIMSGVNELTGWIDHELLFVVTARFGGKWIEAESNGRTRNDTMFAMQLGAHLKFGQHRDAYEIGVAVSRDPTPTADGQSLVAETRLAMVMAGETDAYAIGGRLGKSWVVPQDVDGDAHTRTAYAVGLDGFVKLGRNIELGAYLTSKYEPELAGDPWASPRITTTEAGVLLRWRTRSY